MARSKPSRWDRPKPPHDWRWWVGGTGRILITIGLLMFAFVAYQLWGTGIQTARAQNQLEDEFDQMLIDTSGTAPVVVTSVPVTPVTTATTAPTAAPTDSAPTDSVPETSSPVDTTPTTEPAAPATTAAPSRGAPVTRIKIPSIGVNKIVVEGVSAKDLRKGPGHFPETPMPGQFGNSAIAGHRTTYGAPFGDINKVKAGDLIITITPAGEFHYQARQIVIVNPDEYGRVIPTSDNTKATLTLVSCHPRATATQRIVVIADLIASSGPITEPAPLPPPDDTSTLPGEPNEAVEEVPDTTATEASTVSTPVDSSATETTAAAAETADTTVDTTPGAAVEPVRPAASTDDAFSAGWFSDKAAWPHVALWALALIVWVLACYQLAKRFRRLWLGIAVGFVPFVVLLYFWFENVNRLLPPGL